MPTIASTTPAARESPPPTHSGPWRGARISSGRKGRKPGSALVWVLESGATESDRNIVEQRPGGLSLIVILPPVADLANDPTILHLIEACCPHGILPFHKRLAERELARVLKRPPDDLSASVTDYLAWRGIRIDRDTVHLIRRTIDKSADLHSISALARTMYVSRRALGRRFLSRGLPVPSHWLQLGRLLRVSIKRQNSRESIFSVAYKFGYLVADMNAIQLTAEARGLHNDPARAPSGVSSTHAGVRQVAGTHRRWRAGRPTSRSSPTRQGRPRCSRDSTGSSVPTPTAVRRFLHCISPTPRGSRAAGTLSSGRRRTTSGRRSGASFPRPAHAGWQLLRGPVDTSAQSISIFLPLPVTGCGAFPA